MKPWATAEDFARHCPEQALAGGRLEAALGRACGAVDAVCFGRVGRIGFDRLRAWQQELLVRAVCLQAAWDAAYGEALGSPLASYGINGVSMAFDRARIKTQNGAAVSSEVYGLLVQSGLAHRGIW